LTGRYLTNPQTDTEGGAQQHPEWGMVSGVGEDAIRYVPKELERELVLRWARIPGSHTSAPPGP